MSSFAPLSWPSENASAAARVDSRSEQISSVIKTLISELPPDERDRLLNEITQMLRPIPAPRAGDVLGTIVRLLPRRRDWTVEDLKQSVSQRGVEASPKEIYNALGYLARKGRIRRVGYGRYVVDGVELVTSEDLGGESSRHEDGYRI
jgi:hypothetical protein